MMIRTTYPGQKPRVVEAPPHVARHLLTKDWPLPFVKIVSVANDDGKKALS
jgi:hypothetical protein